MMNLNFSAFLTGIRSRLQHRLFQTRPSANPKAPAGGIFQTLHLQLTSLCSAVTGLAVLILTIVCLFISESGMKKQEYASFLSNLNTMYQNLEMQSALSHQWIRQAEHNYQVILYLTDNGRPLLFQNLPSEQNAAANDRFSRLEALAAEHGIHIRSTSAPGALIRHTEFTFEEESGQSSYASAALIPRPNGTIGVLVLHSLTSIRARMFRQRISFFLTDLAAMTVLTVFFWYFTARMLKPLQENKLRQIQFIASASHELRSPLTVILSNVAAVRSGIMPNNAAFLDTLDSEGKRMSRLVGDMLQLASADNHSWSIQPSAVELDTLLLQTWEDYESSAASHALSWEISLPDEDIPPCTCDSERIRQLLSILIDNAFSCTPEGGCVHLGLTASPSGFRITVADNGPGIPDDQKQAVFERFYRADPSRRSKAHFGLGLCIAQEIARLHHARLTVEDTPGGGATFLLILPV